MKLTVSARSHPLAHRSDALAIARPDQPRHVKRAHAPPSLVSKQAEKRLEPLQKLVVPVAHAPQRRAGELGEEAFDEIEPRAVLGRKGEFEATGRLVCAGGRSGAVVAIA